ncbi:uncharacterized protein PV09_07570 [Verruconis gallopava]|uniref:Uncharacterized protein n=1 Tax=Verruconis gallopava TaxID=253628 RepID=A0A0D1XFU8_9PEZI|nr:uncharacterized protein PV09_07570 [Verruconis gallopava]KIW01056.1 hypothetical protein PV09_07570 [Verruconis gallopava]
MDDATASLLAETPTRPGKQASTLADEQLNIKPLLPLFAEGAPHASDSCAVTSDSTSVADGYSTPFRERRVHIPNGRHDPASRSISSFEPYASIDAQVLRLQNDLETHYSIQCNHRLQKFLLQFPSGVPEEQSNAFKQKEAIERTKFIVYKEAQVAKLLKELSGVQKDPFVSPATPTPHRSFSHFTENDNITNNKQIIDPFFVNHQIPPPPSRPNRDGISSREQTVHGISITEISPGSVALMSSPCPESVAPNCAASTENSNNDGTTSVTGITDASLGDAANNATKETTTWTREQILQAFCETWKLIDKNKAQIEQLRSEIVDLKRVLAALTEASDSNNVNQNSLGGRVSALESQIQSLSKCTAPRIDSALVTNLATEVASLRLEVANAGLDSVSRRAFNAENELTKMTFNNKCALIEKYLGIDITTTGPKPHDVLEALHHRIWHLEEQLSSDDPSSKAGKQYRPLNDFMKTTLGRGNAVVSYSATPGYNNGKIGDDNPICVLRTNIAPVNSVGSHGSGIVPSGNGQAGMFSNDWPGFLLSNTSSSAFVGQGACAPSHFDPADIRHPNYTNNSGGHFSAAHTNLPGSPTNIDLHRGSSVPLLPQGLIDPKPRTNFSHKSPPRRPRATMSRLSPASSGIISPKPRMIENGSRVDSASQAVDVTEDATKEVAKETAKLLPSEPNHKTPPILAQKTANDRAYHAWLNQRPGEFLGKKLSGLGQKE